MSENNPDVLVLGHQPHEVIATYREMHGPGLGLGQIPVDELVAMREATRDQLLSPEEQMHAGWMAVDEAWSCAYSREPGYRDPVLQQALLDEASQMFEKTTRNTHDPLLKIDARLAQLNIPRHQVLVTHTNPANFDKAYAKMCEGNAYFADQLLKRFQTTEDVSLIPRLQQLTLTMLLNEFPTAKHTAVVLPPRFIQAEQPLASVSHLLLDLENSRMQNMRISPVYAYGAVQVKPEILGNHEYPSKHGFGTLQALLDVQKLHKKDLGFRRKPLADPSHPAAQHVAKVYAGLMDNFVAQKDNNWYDQKLGAETDGQSMLEVFHRLNPHDSIKMLHIYDVDEALSEYEMDYREKRLTADEKRAYGSLQLELATGAALGDEKTTALAGQFERAEDILANAARTLKREGRHDEAYECLLESMSVPVYAAVTAGLTLTEARATEAATPDDPVEHAQSKYTERLSETIRYALTSEADKLSPQIIAKMSACLALSAHSSGAFLGVGPTLRQRSGWDVSVLPLLQEGFDMTIHGKLRVAAEEDVRSLHNGVVTATLEDFGGADLADVAWSLVAATEATKATDGGEMPEGAQEYIDWLVARLSRAGDLVL